MHTNANFEAFDDWEHLADDLDDGYYDDEEPVSSRDIFRDMDKRDWED